MKRLKENEMFLNDNEQELIDMFKKTKAILFEGRFLGIYYSSKYSTETALRETITDFLLDKYWLNRPHALEDTINHYHLNHFLFGESVEARQLFTFNLMNLVYMACRRDVPDVRPVVTLSYLETHGAEISCLSCRDDNPEISVAAITDNPLIRVRLVPFDTIMNEWTTDLRQWATFSDLDGWGTDVYTDELYTNLLSVFDSMGADSKRTATYLGCSEEYLLKWLVRCDDVEKMDSSVDGGTTWIRRYTKTNSELSANVIRLKHDLSPLSLLPSSGEEILRKGADEMAVYIFDPSNSNW